VLYLQYRGDVNDAPPNPHNWAGETCLLFGAERVHFTLTDVRTCNIKAFGECTTMTAQDLPATARAMSLVIAIALVATAFAPLLFTAARVVA